MNQYQKVKEYPINFTSRWIKEVLVKVFDDKRAVIPKVHTCTCTYHSRITTDIIPLQIWYIHQQVNHSQKNWSKASHSLGNCRGKW